MLVFEILDILSGGICVVGKRPANPKQTLSKVLLLVGRRNCHFRKSMVYIIVSGLIRNFLSDLLQVGLYKGLYFEYTRHRASRYRFLDALIENCLSDTDDLCRKK